MSFCIRQAMRGIQAFTSGIAIAATVFCIGVAPNLAAAQTENSISAAPLVVYNDRGGLLRERIRKLAQLRQANRAVEIRGNICYSTCTMYLGLQNTCVSPTTTFGFHGPSSYGRKLDAATFERASAIIGSYYPAALRTWYMNDARYSINSVRRITGQNLIAIGVRAC